MRLDKIRWSKIGEDENSRGLGAGRLMEMFIIVPPLNPWDKPADQIMIEMGCSTIRRTAGEAWRIHTRGDMSKVQLWHDRGYRLRRITVELVPEAA